jgi:DNA excision repair protein ERCC-3
VFSQDHPLIVQSDGSILLDAHHPRYEEARTALAPYAEIVSAPEHVHTYRLTAVSVWNALALGRSGSDVKIDVGRFARYGIPPSVLANLDGWIARYGRIRLAAHPDGRLRLEVSDALLAREVASLATVARLVAPTDDPCVFALDPLQRGEIKWALIHAGFPVDDMAGYAEAEPLHFAIREETGFALRAYQREAADAFFAAGTARGGSGVIVLPCGAGKTLVGLAAIQRVRRSALVLVTSQAAANQWVREIRDHTDLPADAVGIYGGAKKVVRPITVATYSVVTARRGGVHPNLSLFHARAFGLVVYDEVHLLPAPVFRMTASLQAMRRLGLTATLLREDGREGDVFALIGPKRYDVPWRVLERQRFVAQAECHEVRVPMDAATRSAYADAEKSERFRVAAEAPCKDDVVIDLLARHPERPALVLGIYLTQLRRLAQRLDAPLITGDTPPDQRDALYQRFREGAVKRLVLSRVGSFAVDLPTASLAVEVSGTFGSRQEEAQRLGRILRPKDEPALFFTIVAKDTVEQDCALRRQRFLTEQGYRYAIVDANVPEAWACA